MDPVTLERIRYCDEQLAALKDLTPEQQHLVEQHRTWYHLQMQAQEAGLGPRPESDLEAQQAWDARKQDVQLGVDAASQEARQQTEGLEAAWNAWQEREQLKTARDALLAGQLTMPGSFPIDPQLLAQHGVSTSAPQWQAEQQQQQQQQHVVWNGQPGSEAEHVEVTALDMGGMQPSYDVNAGLAAYAVAAAQHQQHAAQQAAAPAGPPQPVPEGSKQCRKCHEVKAYTEFYKSKANTDGYDGRCKKCDAIQCTERRRKKQRIDAPTVTEKACHKCGLIKPSGDFYRNRTNRDGLYNNCKMCFADNSKRRQQTLPPLSERMAPTKKCRRCEEQKPASEFYKNRLMLDGLYSHCKSCYQTSAAQRAAERSPVEAKDCRRCGQGKPSSEFYRSKMTSDGLQSYCRMCYKITAAQSRVKKLEEQEQAHHTEAAGPAEGVLFQVAQQQAGEASQEVHLGGAPDALAAVHTGPPPEHLLPGMHDLATSAEVSEAQARIAGLLEVPGAAPGLDAAQQHQLLLQQQAQYAAAQQAAAAQQEHAVQRGD